MLKYKSLNLKRVRVPRMANIPPHKSSFLEGLALVSTDKKEQVVKTGSSKQQTNKSNEVSSGKVSSLSRLIDTSSAMVNPES